MTAWAQEFTNSYYGRLLDVVQERFDVVTFAEYAGARRRERPLLLLRHDIDVSLERALPIARIEAERGVRSTFMVIPRCPTYDIASAASRLAVREITALGHDVGLHFDPTADERAAHLAPTELDASIRAAARSLEDAFGVAVRSVSFHRPASHAMRGPLVVAGLVNAYAAELMHRYLSDSRGSWREGEPIARLRESTARVVQLLTHPIWWGEEHLPATERLRDFLERSARGLGPGGKAELSARLHAALPDDWLPAAPGLAPR